MTIFMVNCGNTLYGAVCFGWQKETTISEAFHGRQFTAASEALAIVNGNRLFVAQVQNPRSSRRSLNNHFPLATRAHVRARSCKIPFARLTRTHCERKARDDCCLQNTLLHSSIRSGYHNNIATLERSRRPPSLVLLPLAILKPIACSTAKMAALDVVFTLAVPVNVARLGAHFEAYKDSLPGLNALRACNRFGSGPQCHINKLPVELIQRISDYYILPPREEQIARWNACLLCYENRCGTDSHYTREQALAMWHSCCLSDTCSCPPDDPDDEDLWEFVAECVSDDGEIHEDRKNEWEIKTQVFLQKEVRLFQKHFGLSIWLSKVYVGHSG